MTLKFDFEYSDFEASAVSPFREMGAYEALWCRAGTTFSSLAKQFASRPDSLPSDFVSPEEAKSCAIFVGQQFEKAEIKFGVRVHGAGEYPYKLRDAASPVEVFYYQGWWDLAASRSVAVVGPASRLQKACRAPGNWYGIWWRTTSPWFLGWPLE